MRSAYLAVLCEEVKRNSDGILDLVGIYSGITSPRASARLSMAQLFLCTEGDSGDQADHRPRKGSLVIKQHLEQSDASRKLIEKMGPIELDLTMRPGQLGHHNKITIEKIDFPEFGQYRFEIIVDGDVLAEIPVLFSLAPDGDTGAPDRRHNTLSAIPKE